MKRQHACSLLLVVATGFACSDSTPIGSIQCIGERIRCGFTEEQQFDPNAGTQFIEPPREHVSSKGVVVLRPAFSARIFEALDPSVEVELTTDANGELWIASQDGSRPVVTKLARDGTALEEHSLTAPKGARESERWKPIFIRTTPRGSAQSRSVFLVTWLRTCQSSSDPDACQIDEVIAFDDFAEAPRRTGIESSSYDDVQANESGDWFFYRGQIEKRDVRGNLVWRQTAFLALENPATWWSARGALREDNELSVLLWSSSSGSSESGSLELWRVDSHGNIEKRHGLAWGGEMPSYAIDPLEQDVIAGTVIDGSIALMRVRSDLSVQGNLIERDDYLALQPDHFVLDSDGAAYVTARAGGRHARDMRALLCQLPMSGTVRCFTLGDLTIAETFNSLVDDLVVPEPGVVYVRTGVVLRRYELPPLVSVPTASF